MFIVADTNSQSVLSATTYKKLNLIKCIFQIDANLSALLKNIKTVSVYSEIFWIMLKVKKIVTNYISFYHVLI